MRSVFTLLFIFGWAVSLRAEPVQISVGSKAFTEGFVLSELTAQTLETDPNVNVLRRFGMGGTGILFEALMKGEIQVYPEYTGTISEAILKDPALRTHRQIQDGLAKLGLTMSETLGFNNTYALAVSRPVAEKHGLTKISDLRDKSSDIKAGFSHEFMTRADGYRALAQRYGLFFKEGVKSLEHALAYEAISKGELDLTDVYSTDAKIEKFDLVVLQDDLAFFPRYEAVFLARLDFVKGRPELWNRLKTFEGKLSEPQMIKLNAAIDIEKRQLSAVLSEFLGVVDRAERPDSLGRRIARRTKEHLRLVAISLIFAICMGIPLGILAIRMPRLGQGILLASGIFQTIPSLALLCFLIPLFGIGEKPAIIALCLYGLLPVVLNTFVGLKNIDQRYLEMSRALGLTGLESLLHVELPLASRSILAGIKTAAIIGIGTATLAALIGAGGYGVPIVSGLAINDMNTILIGAIPAAVMALAAHLVFEWLEILLIPKGLR
jgi:osmoprotectant transport system permease protein